MGKGRIIQIYGAGKFGVQLLADRTNAEKALDRINRWITAKEEQIDKIPFGDPDHKLATLKLNLASLNKQKELLLKIPQDEMAVAWCADYTTYLSGDVGTIEMNGNPKDNIQIVPGFVDGAVHRPEKHGQIQNIRAMTPEQAYYNMAMAPGWKKYMPTYRYGVITQKDKNLCNVDLIEVKDDTILKTINQTPSLTGVPIEYMDCDGTIFEVGDKVLVKFYGQKQESPAVVGFQDTPRMTTTPFVIAQAFCVGTGDDAVWKIGVYDSGGSRLITYDLNLATGVPANIPIRVWGSCEATNSIYVQGAKMWDFGDGNGPIPTMALFRVPISWDFDGLLIKEIGSPGFGLPYTRLAISKGGYLLFSYSQTQRDGYEYLYGFGTHYPHGRVDLAVIPYIWTDLDNDNQMDAGEMYPENWQRYYNSTEAIGFVGNKVWLAITRGYDGVTSDPNRATPSDVAHHIDSLVNLYQFPYYPVPAVFPNTDITPYFTSETPNFRETLQVTEWLHLDYYTIRNLKQIIGHNGKRYLIYTSWIEVYEDQTNARILLVYPPYSFYNYQRAEFITYQDFWILAVKAGGPVYYFEADTLQYLNQTVLPDNNPDAAGYAAIVNVPTTPMMLQLLNAARARYGLYPLSFSRELSDVCQAHVNWLLSTGRTQHAGPDGKLGYDRGRDAGFVSTDEVIVSGAFSSERRYDQIASALAGWEGSPQHWAVLSMADAVIMGYAVGRYPDSVKTIIDGPGNYNPETHEYSTVEVARELKPSEIGNTWVYLVMVGYC